MARGGARGPAGAGRTVLMGAIAGAHGVGGLVRLKSFAERPEDIAAYGPLSGEDGGRFEVEVRGRAKGALVARIAGVEDRDAAERLKGTRLYLPRAALPPPEPGEFYHADLVGLRAERPDGAPVGEVVAAHDFGAGDLIEVRLAGSRKTVLLPFDAATVPEVDLDGGRLTVDPMPGLLDEAGESGAAGGEGA